MIITKLIGGLGNQMFQYAAGKALAVRHHTLVEVDTSHLLKDPKGAYTPRYFELNVFEKPVPIASDAEVQPFLAKRKHRLTRLLQRKFPFLYPEVYFSEYGHQFNDGFLRCPENTYLDGFWQSEKYFEAIAPVIRDDFKFKQEIVSEGQEWFKKISEVRSVAIHVRRGDYVSLQNANEYHGLCSAEYYHNAVDVLAKDGSLSLFVFSDDLDWCKENLRFSFPVHFVSGNKTATDMYLMSKCNHNVIANSSFSWWGAWLNDHPKKKVIAPKQWYKDPAINTNDIIPVSWIKM